MYGAAVEAIERAYENKGAVGLSTEFKDLDAKVGLRPSDLIVVAGRPSMGKTSLATSIVRNHQTTPTHFFSLEMSPEQIGEQIISAETGIPSDRLQRGEIDEDEWRRVFTARDKLGKQPLRIDATGGISIGQLAARARRVKRQMGTQLIIVDYMQLMRASKRAENRVQEVSEITAGLNALAKELNVPILALLQLSRDVEKRTDKRPQLSDLRESGSIEQDADLVLFVYREEYYLERQRPTHGTPEFQDWLGKMEQAKGNAEVIIGKQRRGPIGTVQLQFDAACTRFSNLAHGGQSLNSGTRPVRLSARIADRRASMTHPTDNPPGSWPRLMRAETATRYVDERSVEAFRRGVGTIYPMPIKVPGKGDRRLKDDLDEAIEKLTRRPNHIRDASAVL
jgi:replicative DNA helicase